MTRIALVLRSGGDFTAAYVERLAAAFAIYVPNIPLYVLTDIALPEWIKTVPLKYAWPGWWSKMELFRPELEGDTFYVDLDTVIVGPIHDIVTVGKLTMLRDFYQPHRPASGMMYLPEAVRREVWREWNASTPEKVMSNYLRGGDQAFLASLEPIKSTAHFQDLFQKQIISYKVHVRPAQNTRREVGVGVVPMGTRVVCFHGKPRPSEVDWLEGVPKCEI